MSFLFDIVHKLYFFSEQAQHFTRILVKSCTEKYHFVTDLDKTGIILYIGEETT